MRSIDEYTEWCWRYDEDQKPFEESFLTREDAIEDAAKDALFKWRCQDDDIPSLEDSIKHIFLHRCIPVDPSDHLHIDINDISVQIVDSMFEEHKFEVDTELVIVNYDEAQKALDDAVRTWAKVHVQTAKVDPRFISPSLEDVTDQVKSLAAELLKLDQTKM